MNNEDKFDNLIDRLYYIRSCYFNLEIKSPITHLNFTIDGLTFYIDFDYKTYKILGCDIPMYYKANNKTFELFYKIMEEANLLKHLPNDTLVELKFNLSIKKTKDKELKGKILNNDMRSRVGKMYISEELLLSENITEAFKVLDIRIIRAEHLVGSRSFEYYFYSKFAEVLEEGCNAPEYNIEVTKTDFDQLVFELKKC